LDTVFGVAKVVEEVKDGKPGYEVREIRPQDWGTKGTYEPR